MKDILEALKSPELLEILSDIEHERWSSWEKYKANEMNFKNAVRWVKLRNTSYADLPEHSKESDRVEARKTLGAIVKFLKTKG